MKFSDRITNEAKNARNAQIASANIHELNNFKSNLNISELPDAFITYIQNLDYRISGIRLMSYDSFFKRFPDNAKSDSFCAVPDGKNAKTGFPVLYVYCPELVYIVQKLEDKNKKVGNLKRIASYFYKKYGLHLESNPAFSNFCLNVLPANVPFDLFTDGSRVRVTNLAADSKSQLYGSTEDDIFAVAHTYKDQPSLTIFCKDLDCVGEFAAKISKKLEITYELAMKISEALPHDQYYSVFGIESKFEKYVTLIPKLLNCNSGDNVHDLLQGDVEVFDIPNSKKVALDLDDEFPSAILVGNRLNLYIPGWGDLGADE